MTQKQSVNSKDTEYHRSITYFYYLLSMVSIALLRYFGVAPEIVVTIFGWLAWAQFWLMVLGVSLMCYAIWFSNGIVHGRIKADPDTVHAMSKAHKSLGTPDWAIIAWSMIAVPGSTWLAGYTTQALAMLVIDVGFFAIRVLMFEPNTAKK